ncbi:antibiotic biosynthesis monooxygenase [Mycoplasma sp. CSL10137]|uniref:antibiotic biosynthesis monooxygenase n=1 Tax=unclassified Mycoplasma TaxID=2683645 RepID=UPI00197C0C36|nr:MULTISPECIES: antibiotic biosynthesis monooxygenase [unclassified Mycoplasma]MBN4083240.1 antibiotic biosynthesis monooxygenase [Mycoplasma sp. CSL10137]MBN4084463.1 antibiotic biosynthesis monooxygenase [Mycoplasma sp. CSL10166]MBU4692943.1 antibiotic biosynthesis monooxygenase [Mycoplasma sp. CSL7491-lung]MCU4706576.1 antibiotic biosynthesis monooxygenase [Mycoplasma sp. CSL7503-lung]
MIYAQATIYTIDPEKLKGFIDYLYVFTQKTRMKEKNLSYEYGLMTEEKILVIQRWSTKQDYEDFINIEEFAKELKMLKKMSKNVKNLYQIELTR